ncbi:MAG: hypothetical protein WAL90_10235 [Desulfobacterales bacterium]
MNRGDNEIRRNSCTRYIVREPQLSAAGFVDPEPLTWVSRIEYVYADDPRIAKALRWMPGTVRSCC